MLLETRVLERGGTGLGLVQVGRSHQHDVVEGPDGLAGGLHPQAVCQVEGLSSVIECRRAVVGGTKGMGQSVRVDSQDRSIIVVDVGGELGILGTLVMSASLPAATLVVTALSLGRSIFTCTAIEPALLLL